MLIGISFPSFGGIQPLFVGSLYNEINAGCFEFSDDLGLSVTFKQQNSRTQHRFLHRHVGLRLPSRLPYLRRKQYPRNQSPRSRQAMFSNSLRAIGPSL